MSCVVPHCRSTFKSTRKSEESITFHRFPENHIRQKWIEAVGRNNWTPTKHHRICSKQFKSDCYYITRYKKRLLPNAIPTIFQRPLEVMPCRNGCSAPTAGPVCCCARRCSGRRRPSGQFCTADTCSNPEFCIAYRPQFCPNAQPDEEDQHVNSSPSPSPLFPDITTPWPPPNFHHPLSSAQNRRHSHTDRSSLCFPHSFSSQQSLSTREPCCQNRQPNPTQSPRKSTARLSIGKPSLSRLDSGQNLFDYMTRPSSRPAMRSRLATIGRPSLTRLDFGCCQADRYKQDDSTFGGVGFRLGDLSRNADRCGRGSCPGSFHQEPEVHEDDFGTDARTSLSTERPEQEQDASCECRMPPAFARFRCTGNLGGQCDCPKCDHNELLDRK